MPATEGSTIEEILTNVAAGRVVLPDFQRSFVWKPDDIRDLIVSVLGNYYIGSMLFLDTVRDEAPFALRLIEGVSQLNPTAKISSITQVLLDGQQRTSSLFYALHGPDIPLAGRKGAFRFFINIPKLLDEDWDGAVSYAVVTNKKLIREKRNSLDEIETTELGDVPTLIERINNGPHKGSLTKLVRVINDFNTYTVRTVQLNRDTPLFRIVETFERINRTGEPLSVTDLLVAKLYRDGVKFRDLITNSREEFSALEEVDTQEVLKVVCLFRGKELRRAAILELSAENFAEDWREACISLQEAYMRATDTKSGYGVFNYSKWIPFAPMLVPLAGLLARVRKLHPKHQARAYNKIDEWYWVSVFANRYNEAVHTQSSADYTKMIAWIDDGERPPEFVSEFNPSNIDFETDSRSSAVYRGTICLTVLKGARDFQTDQPPEFERMKVQDDHIFPRSKYKYNKVLNRTLISTNAFKSDQDPSVYFGAINTLVGRDKLLETLQTHFIGPAALDALTRDDLPDFIAARRAEIMKEVERRTPHHAS